MTMIVYRQADERTAKPCLEQIRSACGVGSATIIVIEADPFRTAVRLMLESAGENGVLAVDADVSVSDDSQIGESEFQKALRWLEADRPEHVNFLVRDRFRGVVPAGVHWHGPKVVRGMLRLLESGWHKSPQAAARYALRAESTLSLEACRILGVSPTPYEAPVGQHDYGQWYRDLWGKYLSRGWRDGQKIRPWMTRLRRTDPEELAVLLGLEASRTIRPGDYSRRRLRELFDEHTRGISFPSQEPIDDES